MRATIHIDDELLKKAAEYTGIEQKTELVRRGLEALVQREAAERLIALGGTMPKLKVPRRRRVNI